MIAIGGTDPDITDEDADPWPQGLAIFDLTDMVWKTTYNSTALPYVTSKQVKDYNAANKPYPQWSDPMVEQWITGITATGSNPASTSSSSPSSTPSSSSSSHSSNTGSIVGGVVGGVGGAILFAVLAWFLLRRRRRAHTRSSSREQEKFEKAELEARRANEKIGAELDDTKSGELYGSSPVHEMEGSHAGHELSPTGSKPEP